jgi:hypothetical protein
VSGDRRYHEPFQVSGYMDRTFEWTQPELARFISEQLAARPEGPHCENTKIWPFCVSETGLGLAAYDAVNGTGLHAPFERWADSLSSTTWDATAAVISSGSRSITTRSSARR